MKHNIKSVLGVFALLFALLIPASAQYAQYYTPAQVQNLHAVFSGHGRDLPVGVYAATLEGSGLWVYSNGSMQSDTGSAVQMWATQWQQDLFMQVQINTGDYWMAMQAALGLLTQEEEEEAKWGDIANGVEYLGWVGNASPYAFYFYGEGGGGDDHDDT